MTDNPIEDSSRRRETCGIFLYLGLAGLREGPETGEFPAGGFDGKGGENKPLRIFFEKFL